jgi:hypothetical protein
MLAATVGAGALIAAGGAAAQASTGPALTGHASTSYASTSHAGKIILVRVRYVVAPGNRAPLRALTQTPPYPSNCAYNDYTCTYDSGWSTYNRGSCTQDTTATWWGVPKNILNVTLTVTSPYWFSGCRAYATVYFGMNSGPPLAVGPFFGYACAVLDPTCSSTQARSYQVQQAVPQAQLTNLNSIYTYTTP